MTYPKIKPCPICDQIDEIGVYTYEHGWKHVECDRCFYLGPGEGRIRDAIRSHNAKREENVVAYAKARAIQPPVPK